MSEYISLEETKYTDEKPVAVSFGIGSGTKVKKITPEMHGVPLEDALEAIDKWIKEKGEYGKQVKSLIGPILVVGRWTMYHIVLIRRPETGLYQAIAEQGLVVKWEQDTPDLKNLNRRKNKKKFVAGIEVRDEPIPPEIKLPINETENIIYSCINDKDKGIDHCIDVVTGVIASINKTPYHVVLDSDFTNDIEYLGRQVVRFHKSESKKYHIKSLYFEMSSLEDFSHLAYIFAYDIDGGPQDIDWLANYKGDRVLADLKGFGRFRNVFKNEDPTIIEAYEDIRRAAELLVVLKFQKFIQNLSSLISVEDLAIYAALHESDLVAKVK